MIWSTSALVRPLRSALLTSAGYTFEKAMVKMRCFSAMAAAYLSCNTLTAQRSACAA